MKKIEQQFEHCGDVVFLKKFSKMEQLIVIELTEDVEISTACVCVVQQNLAHDVESHNNLFHCKLAGQCMCRK